MPPYLSPKPSEDISFSGTAPHMQGDTLGSGNGARSGGAYSARLRRFTFRSAAPRPIPSQRRRRVRSYPRLSGPAVGGQSSLRGVLVLFAADTLFDCAITIPTSGGPVKPAGQQRETPRLLGALLGEGDSGVPRLTSPPLLSL